MINEKEGLFSDKVILGQPDFVKETLCRRIGALSHHRGFHRKVGITSNLRRRWSKHKKNGWAEMHALFKSMDREDVIYLECKLLH